MNSSNLVSLILITLFFLFPLIFAEDYNYDLIVFGASPSGIIAAVEASRHDLHKMAIAIVAPEPYIGGMVAGGLGKTDIGDSTVIGGLALEFFDRVGQKYGRNSPQWTFEPHVASVVFNEMLNESGIHIHLNHYLSEGSNVVIKQGTVIQAIETEGPNGSDSFAATMFIDASYEGSLMAAAGVSYFVGREASKDFNESYAGYRGPGGDDNNGMDFSVDVSAYYDDGTLLPHIQPAPTTNIGDGDDLVQAYNFRLCVTRNKTNKVPFPQPADYNPADFILASRYAYAIIQQLHKTPNIRNYASLGELPNGKYDMNNNGPVSTDLIGENKDYPEANRQMRRAIWERHYYWQAGLLYYLSNDPSVPIALRTDVAEYGLCKDEFVETNNWPWQLYVREARRMISDFIFSEKDVVSEKTKSDTIGMGSYPIDSHNTQRFPTPDGFVHNEGDMYMSSKGTFQIPYRVLAPKRSEATNLLVTVCMSSTHIGYGPLRLEPQYMILGHAAGLVAAEAHYYNISVQNINITDVQNKLRMEKAILES